MQGHGNRGKEDGASARVLLREAGQGLRQPLPTTAEGITNKIGPQQLFLRVGYPHRRNHSQPESDQPQTSTKSQTAVANEFPLQHSEGYPSS